MVNRFFIFFLYFIFFISALMYFTQKTSIYYFLEKELKPYAVIISDEEILDSGFTLKIEHANISLKQIQTASISEVNVKLFAFYNAIDFKDIVLSSVVKSFIPLHIGMAKVTYSIFAPLNVNAVAVGGLGEVYAQINVLDRTVHVKLIPSKLMLKNYRSTLHNFVKNKSGEYEYDKTF